MKIKRGTGKTEYGRGIDIKLTADEVVLAIESYLLSHGVRVSGPRTVKVNEELIDSCLIYVDPYGSIMVRGKVTSGR